MLFEETRDIGKSKNTLSIGTLNDNIFKKSGNSLLVFSSDGELSSKPKIIERHEVKEISAILRKALEHTNRAKSIFPKVDQFLKFKVRYNEDRSYIVQTNTLIKKRIPIKIRKPINIL